MLRIKKLDIFVVKSFSILLVGTFFICLFIFMMQFLWRYVDELVGKGLEMKVMAQFFFYSALSLVPVSLPLAVLLASLITFGNFGERFELLAMKAAGISLIKIMRPLIVLVSCVCFISFYFQNVIAPHAQAKLGTLLISMKQKSPELDIPENVFYSEIPDYNLKVGRKDRDTGMLYDVLIYNFKDGVENAHIIYADSGYMEMTADKQHLYLHLYDGELFENLKSQNFKSENVPYRRESFKEKHSIIEFDSDFNMADASIMSGQATTKSMSVISHSIDSMTHVGDSIGRRFFNEAMRVTYNMPEDFSRADSIKMKQMDPYSCNLDSLFESNTLLQRQRIISSAASSAAALRNDYNYKVYSLSSNDYQIRRHTIEWHRKITLSISCLLFFFIGTSLGGIIRKGGLGMPVIVSVLIFIVYYVIDNSGYKLARDGKWIVWMGVWLSSAILAPLGLFLTYKSNKDSVVLNLDVYIEWIKRVFGIRRVRHMEKKGKSIFTPEYAHDLEEIDALTETCQAYQNQMKLRRLPNYFRVWMSHENDHVIKDVSARLELLVKDLSYSDDVLVVGLLNEYPILAPASHIHPFTRYWLNCLAGIFFPVGIFFYIRICLFRRRLDKDITRILSNNKDLKEVLKKVINN